MILIFSTMISDALAESKAQALYEGTCMACHGEDGTGGMMSSIDLTTNKNLATMNEKKLVERIRRGIETPGSSLSMPPKGGNPDLSDNDLTAIVRYMRANFFK